MSMAPADTRELPIGTVVRLTGLSSHTLRKWESRYALVSPRRTESGRRVYVQADIDRLVLVRDLSAKGHQLGRLSGLSDDALRDLLDQSSQARTMRAPKRVLVVGHVLAAEASELRSRFRADLSIQSVDLDEWFRDGAVPAAGDAIIAEAPTLDAAQADRLVRLAEGRRVVVVYGYAQKRSLNALRDSGVTCLRAPIDLESVRLELEGPSLVATGVGVVPPRRFSDAAIARVRAAPTAVRCECPGHIADLLYELLAFERYSRTCESEQAKDQALHRYLAEVSGHARAAFEEALERVAFEEGIPLD